MSVKIKARAKLNLTLNVEGMYNDLYHSLSSVLTTVDVFDVVEVFLRDDNAVNVYENGKLNSFNVANKVAAAIIDRFGLCGVDIKVDKGIAIMGGMGGSSVDAAATIVAMSLLHNISIDTDMMNIAAQFGSDIAYMLRGGLAIATGKGDDIKFVNCANKFCFTVINGPRLSTTQVFAEYDKLPDYTRYDNDALLSALTSNNLSNVRQLIGNNLQAAAVRICPDITDIFSACSKLSLPQPTMTGSGGNFFLIHKTMRDAEKTAEKLKEFGIDAYATVSADDGIEVL